MYKLLAIFAIGGVATNALSSIEAVARGVALEPLAAPLEARQATFESGTAAAATATATATRSVAATATGTGTSSSGVDIQYLLDSYPSECSSTCQSSFPIIQACYELDVPGCLAVCQQSAYDSFIDCQNCGIRESGATVTAAQARQFRRFQQDIEQGCAAQGTAVTSKELEFPSSSSSSSSSRGITPTSSGSGSGGAGLGLGGGASSGTGPSPTSTGPSGGATSPPAAANPSNGAVGLPAQVGGVLGGLLVAVLAI